MERKANPLIDLVYEKTKESTFRLHIPIATKTIATNISDIDIAPTEFICLSIDNLVKQSLISIPTDKSYTDVHLYDNILSSEFYLEQQQKYPDRTDGFKFSHTKKMITTTNLGVAFYNICVVD